MENNKLDTIVVDDVEYDIGSSNNYSYEETSGEWVKLTLDKDDKIIEGIEKDGTIFLSKITSPTIDEINVRLNRVSRRLEGKKIVLFGDSITEFRDSTNKRYSDYLSESTGAITYNVGIGGAQIRQRDIASTNPTTTGTGYAGLDILTMVRAAVTQNFDIVDACALWVKKNYGDDNQSIIETLKSIPWDEVDIVTLFAGTNDWNNGGDSRGVSGEFNEYTTLGALNLIIKELLTAYPHVRLYVFTPIIRFIPDISISEFSSETTYNIGDFCKYSSVYYKFINLHHGDWSDADVVEATNGELRRNESIPDNYLKNGCSLKGMAHMIETECELNHIPCCNWYSSLGWNGYNSENYFQGSDDTHPSKGYGYLASKMQSFIESNF